jgi:hypothetical protein
MKNLLHIGADAEKVKGRLPEITKALLALMATSAGDDVKKAAIDALTKAYAVENVSVNNCTFTGKSR